MFYPSLEPLKASEIGSLVERFDELLATAFSTNRKRIAPSFVGRSLGVDLSAAMKMVAAAEEAGVGEVAYELMCPYCGASADRFKEVTDAVRQIQACRICNEPYQGTTDDVWVTFSIVEAPKKA